MMVMPLPARTVRIGREPGNDVVLSDLTVSRHHAELRRLPALGYEIVDLRSHYGTFVNGRRVSSQLLTERDLVSIGHSTFRLKDGELRQFVDAGSIVFSARDLVVKVAGGKLVLNGVTFPVQEGPRSASSGPLARAGPRCSTRSAEGVRLTPERCSTTTGICTRTTTNSGTASAWSRALASCAAG
jgi:ABC transport system ATP-binding/permease protein